MTFFSYTEETYTSWRYRYTCHCGKIATSLSVFFSGCSEYEDTVPPESDYICPACGCEGSYMGQKGRYKITTTKPGFLKRKIVERVWIPWTWNACSYKKETN